MCLKGVQQTTCVQISLLPQQSTVCQQVSLKASWTKPAVVDHVIWHSFTKTPHATLMLIFLPCQGHITLQKIQGQMRPRTTLLSGLTKQITIQKHMSTEDFISHAPPSFLVSPHQKHSNGRSSEESCQDVRPVVAVLSHSNHAHEHGQAEQGEADGGLGQPRAFGLEHQCHVHLKRGIKSAHTIQQTQETTQDTCTCGSRFPSKLNTKFNQASRNSAKSKKKEKKINAHFHQLL